MSLNTRTCSLLVFRASPHWIVGVTESWIGASSAAGPLRGEHSNLYSTNTPSGPMTSRDSRLTVSRDKVMTEGREEV